MIVVCRKRLVRTLCTTTEPVLLEDLEDFMHGRGNKERRDSVNKSILLERKNHQEALEDIAVDDSFIKKLEKRGLGQKKKKYVVFNEIGNASSNRKTNTGAGGFSIHLASASENWPIFKHLLPEIAFAGHSNSGKSTLVNAMAGITPKKGPASVSDRAGWTDQICFYQLGKKPPIITMADLPGYGHAVATPAMKKHWIKMTRDYLSNRSILSLCCILVDSTRGLCGADKSLLRFLNSRNIPWKIILTKCDLLKPIELAQSMALVDKDLAPFTPYSVFNRNYIKLLQHKETLKNSDDRDDDDDSKINDQDRYFASILGCDPEQMRKQRTKKRDWGDLSNRHNNSNSSNNNSNSNSIKQNDSENYDDEFDGDEEDISGNTADNNTDGKKKENPNNRDIHTTKLNDNSLINKAQTNKSSTITVKNTTVDWNKVSYEDMRTVLTTIPYTDETYPFGPLIIPVSSNTGAGIHALWLELTRIARRSCVDVNSSKQDDIDDDDIYETAEVDEEAVIKLVHENFQTQSNVIREHVNAKALRRETYLKNFKTRK